MLNISLPSSGYCDLITEGGILFSGPDAEKFLQGQLSCDLTKVSVESATFGTRCNLQGRVVSFFRLIKWQDGYLMLLPREIISLTIDSLKKYAVFFKCKIDDYSEHIAIACFWHNEENKSNFDYLPTIINQCSIDTGIIYIKHHQTQNFSSYLAISHTTEKESLLSKLNQQFHVAKATVWHAYNILNKIPTLSIATSEKYMPSELNLIELDAVSFEKGCYLGQEIIARIHYRGQIKQHLFVIKTAISSDITFNLPVIDAEEKTVGYIVDYVKLDEENLIALALLKETAIQNSLTLQGKTVELIQ